MHEFPTASGNAEFMCKVVPPWHHFFLSQFSLKMYMRVRSCITWPCPCVPSQRCVRRCAAEICMISCSTGRYATFMCKLVSHGIASGLSFRLKFELFTSHRGVSTLKFALQIRLTCSEGLQSSTPCSAVCPCIPSQHWVLNCTVL